MNKFTEKHDFSLPKAKKYFKELFLFNWRLSRKEFLGVIALLALLSYQVSKLSAYVSVDNLVIIYIILGLKFLLLYIPTIFAYIKRCHDFWRNILYVIPRILIGLILYVLFLSLEPAHPDYLKYTFGIMFIQIVVFWIYFWIPGTKWENKYWSDPLLKK